MECALWVVVANGFRKTEIKDQQTFREEVTEYFRPRAQGSRGGKEHLNQGGSHALGKGSEV